MLSIADELKIIQQSTTEEERRRRAQQLQQRLQEDALRRKLRNVRLIGSVERLAERASSLRQLTDRLRLIKRQYEVLATHLPDDDPSSQSQLAEPAAALRHSQSVTSVGEAEHHRQTALKAASGDPTADLSHLVEGYYDPRLAARGWQGAADPWGPSSQQLGRDELGRSTESRAALLRSRIATSATVRSEPPAPPGDRGVNYGAVGGQTWERGRETEWDRDARGPGPGPRDPSDWERSEWDRSGPGERSSAPMQDRSVSEYSVSAPGRRRAAPLAWDGTLDGVASRWGTLERPTAADEQLQQLDSALARQRQLLAATAAATETAAARDAEDTHHAPLPRLRTGSWLDPESSTIGHRRWESGPDPRTSDGGPQYRGQEHYTGDHGSYLGDQGTHQMPRETNVRFADSSDNERYHISHHRDHNNIGGRSSHGDRSSFAGRSDYLEPPDAKPRCPAHQAMHEAGQTRRYEEDGARFERDPSGGGEGERLREMGEDTERAERQAEEREIRRRESLRRREEEEEEERRRWEEKRRAEEEGMREEERRKEEERRREDEMRRAEEERRREEEERRQEERKKEDQRRQVEEQRRREEADRMREEARAAAEHSTATRKASVTSNASSHGVSWNGRSAVAAAPQMQSGANNGKQNAKKKKNMDWLLGGGHSSGESDGERPEGGRGKPTGDVASDTKYSGAPSTADRPAAASRQSSHGSTAAAPVPTVRRTVDTSSSDETAPARTPAPAAAALAPAAAKDKPMKIRLDSGSDSYHLSADLGGDESDDDFWG
ncbi:MAP7 domain-containing protein 1-like [Amphibalanus amphitrite]|uniref:MAP7 domain-containing protein 1-like n=1 Tax=Amphibalanus amphitrite TaxID=1232801 RepID=UPI001C9173B4|nr:MAP7 domain-containing protein 1-like [Amphibalanus amphitrite]XP_043190703.1 MAP7 domain-containing protein 1-like [Amphibalanus amphitrite]XP_043190704.1 MAP7 domain-containing protein 1-like [Amphibalanus amphitrite]XP_043190705.1 MAP7 domain-containing protein 1-like [Amphibalanus amphitrite]XP_043190706.1 MAP7 domain-containing protein 1-like [Amphibalanus amphitrite]XP_043190708.1 MAP7 domain-containing protein 1-like [Amphibalanus amphitrite]